MIEPQRHKEQKAFPPWWVCWAIFAGLSAMLIISRLYYPQDFPATTLCGFKTLVGLPCPGCGLTRSFCSMAKGNFFRAFDFNIFGPALFLSSVALWLASLLCAIGFRKPLGALIDLMFQPRFIKLSLGVLGFYWIGRIVYLLATVGTASTIGKGLLAHIF